jgi:hypothetical protein
MSPHVTSARELRAILRGFAEAKTNSNDAESVAAVAYAVESFTEIMPADEQPPADIGEAGVADDEPTHGPRSWHVVLSWRKLIEATSRRTAQESPEVPARPGLVPLVALYVWDRLWLGQEHQLSDVEALTILALWQHRTARNLIAEDDGLVHTNRLRESVGLDPLARADYEAAIARLSSLECLKADAGLIWLREWVTAQY